ncbi:MAG TPA: SGNH/GDSL hydrolase family protein [Kineosporiaceae bacterium]
MPLSLSALPGRRLLGQIVDEQVPAALDLGADLVSIIGGGNDVPLPGVDVDRVTSVLEEAVARLVASGATVLMSTSYDPRMAPLVRRTRGLAGIFAANVWSIARRQGALVLDLWGTAALQDRRMWAEDRIHLTSQGHRRVAGQTLELLDIPGGEGWDVPLAPGPVRSRREAWTEDAAWLREQVVPWVGRRIRGRSNGDGLSPKSAIPMQVTAPDSEPQASSVRTEPDDNSWMRKP